MRRASRFSSAGAAGCTCSRISATAWAGEPLNLRIASNARPLSEPASQVAYRTAQEGLTNARKHAPGQPVTLGLAFEPGHVTVAVTNPLPPEDQHAPLADTGAGAGLTGLKERAALAGGTFEAGPADGIWRVDLTIPT